MPRCERPSREDLAACAALIRRRSRSFHLASRLLPPEIRAAAVATYAFCRGADDDVDDAAGVADAARRHAATRDRLARLYAGLPMDTATGRAFAWVVEAARIPREEPEALLDGMAQDLDTVRIADEGELLVYAYRAAGVVGRMMSRIMRRDDDEALRRATDLGIAMQLTNIARDVGEDARRGRVYLPATWLAEAGSSAYELLGAVAGPAGAGPAGAARGALRGAAPVPRGVLAANRRLLARAERSYAAGIAGIRLLPPSCRTAILTAALLYREIGRRVLARDGDGVTSRVRVSAARKLALAATAAARCALDPRLRGGPIAADTPGIARSAGATGATDVAGVTGVASVAGAARAAPAPAGGPS